MSENDEKKQKVVAPSVDELLEQTLEQLAAAEHRYEEEHRWRGYYEEWYSNAKKELDELKNREDCPDPSKFWCRTCKAFHQVTCIK